MPTYSFDIISVTYLSFNPGTGAFDFSASYTHWEGRYRIEVSDDDNVMNAGGDPNQIATVYDMDGNIVTSGPITVPAYAEIDLPGGGTAFLDRVEVNGMHLGYLPSTALTPGTSYPVRMSSTFEEQHSYYQANSVPCFGPGTWIATARGACPMDVLRIGDRVQTLDHGLQPIGWIGRARVSAAERRRAPALAPVCIAGGTAHFRPPETPLWLSGSHTILARSVRAELFFGSPEVLCPARHVCTSGPDWPQDAPIDYTHILFDRHEIVCANGLWVESLYPGPQALASLPVALARQVRRHLNAEGVFSTARPVLTGRETRVLFDRPATLPRAA